MADYFWHGDIDGDISNVNNYSETYMGYSVPASLPTTGDSILSSGETITTKPTTGESDANWFVTFMYGGSTGDIFGGTYNGTVEAENIYDGTFNGSVSVVNYIYGGTFNGDCSAYFITGGTFNGNTYLSGGYVFDGSFYGDLYLSDYSTINYASHSSGTIYLDGSTLDPSISMIVNAIVATTYSVVRGASGLEVATVSLDVESTVSSSVYITDTLYLGGTPLYSLSAPAVTEVILSDNLIPSTTPEYANVLIVWNDPPEGEYVKLRITGVGRGATQLNNNPTDNILNGEWRTAYNRGDNTFKITVWWGYHYLITTSDGSKSKQITLDRQTSTNPVVIEL